MEPGPAVGKLDVAGRQQCRRSAQPDFRRAERARRPMGLFISFRSNQRHALYFRWLWLRNSDCSGTVYVDTAFDRVKDHLTMNFHDTADHLNDFWRYSYAQKQWFFISGNPVKLQGTYGTLGVFSAANVPGARWGHRAVIHPQSGYMILFGGIGADGSVNPPVGRCLSDSWH